MFDELVQGFNNAWLLLKHRLKSYGKYLYSVVVEV